jgi:hypothetical protein
VDPRPWTLAENGRRDQIVPAGFQPREQSIRALRLLGSAPDDAPHQEKLRIVAAMEFGVYGLHADSYSTDRAGLSRSARRRKIYAPAVGRLAAAMATIWASRRLNRDDAPRSNVWTCRISSPSVRAV